MSNRATFYLDREMIEDRKLNSSVVERAAAQFLLNDPGIEVVFTKTQLESGQLPTTPLGRQAMLSWEASRSGDLLVIQKTFFFCRKL